MTGTPFSGGRGPQALWAYVQILDPARLPRTFTAFRSYITQPCHRGDHATVIARGPSQLLYLRYVNLDWHSKLTRRIAWRVERAPVLEALPEPLDILHPVTLEPKARTAYDDMEREMIVEIDGQTIDAPLMITRMLRLQQMTGGTMQVDGKAEITVSTAKRQALTELLRDVDEPVVAFARFTADLASIHSAATDAGKTSSFEISGKRSELAEWQAACDAGQSPVLAAQLQAGSEGISLTSSSLGVFYSTDFSLLTYHQARARLQRPGQPHQVRFIHLVAQNTIDQHVYRALSTRQDFVDQLRRGVARWPRG